MEFPALDFILRTVDRRKLPAASCFAILLFLFTILNALTGLFTYLWSSPFFFHLECKQHDVRDYVLFSTITSALEKYQAHTEGI